MSTLRSVLKSTFNNAAETEASFVRFHENFYLTEIRVPSVDGLDATRTSFGQDYRAAIDRHVRDIVGAFQTPDRPANPERLVIVDIPRGGTPCGISLHKHLSDLLAGSPARVDLVHSQTKHDPASLYPAAADLADCSLLVLADGVVASGKTICDHIAQIPEAFKGEVIVFSNMTAEMGAREIEKALRERGLTGRQISGRYIPDDECEWKDINGKNIYLVGVRADRNIDYNIPDFGDAVTVTPPSP